MEQVVLGEDIHHETDRTEIHAVDRNVEFHDVVERLQHQAVAAQGDNYFCCLKGIVAIAGAQTVGRDVGFLGAIADKANADRGRIGQGGLQKASRLTSMREVREPVPGAGGRGPEKAGIARI